MKPLYDKAIRLVARHRLVFAVMGVITIALVSTAISMSLYISSGASSLDLSRPGYSQARTQLKDVPNESFSPTGTLDQAAFDQFKQLYNQQRGVLDDFGDFKDAALDDSSLQLSTQQ